MVKKCKTPEYNALGSLPETQLQIMHMAFECGAIWPEQLDTLTTDEQALVGYGYLSVKDKNGLMKLNITSAGIKAAPKVKEAQAKWDCFNSLAPKIAMCIEDNTGSTLTDHKINVSNKAITALLFNCLQISDVEDTYGESYSVEIETLKKAGVIGGCNLSGGEQSARVEQGLYSGMILRIEGDKVVQKVGRDPGQVVVHDIGKLSRVPKVGEVAEIRVGKDGVGEVAERGVGRELE